MGLWDNIKGSFRQGNYLIRLIYINTAVFLALLIVSAICYPAEESTDIGKNN